MIAIQSKPDMLGGGFPWLLPLTAPAHGLPACDDDPEPTPH
ncbi:hypothetical protein U5801_25710 [Lamprobacter modestohalophilus]|nr:hypothetical protein [Lamprobacter modestohalophilus]MEA1053178.1 hypothetical protein [Lamprobacter modestohalophilus]